MPEAPAPHRQAQPPGRIPLAMKRYRPDELVDFVIVGSGSSGGILARELSRAGFSVVVLEQGPWLDARDFGHDEHGLFIAEDLTNEHIGNPNTFRHTDKEKATVRPAVWYARAVGGGSIHFSANFWRFPESEFRMATRFGVPPGTSVADWPISYAELEPYYTKVEWEIGVSGDSSPNPFLPPRSRPFPMGPVPVTGSGVVFEQGARKLGLTVRPSPLAITSRQYNGRSPCVACGFCIAHGCEVNAKSSTLVTTIPQAVATGRCEVRPLSRVVRVVTDRRGRATGVAYLDAQRRELMQRARGVVLAANGAETPRLLLLSATSRFPNGLANASGMVGRNLVLNGGKIVHGMHPKVLNSWKGVVATRAVWDWHDLDPQKTGLYGGGAIDARHLSMGQPIWGTLLRPPGEARWGSAWKRELADWNNRGLMAYGHTSTLPIPGNRVDLDPELKDAWGVPAIRVTHQDDPRDFELMDFFVKKSTEILAAAGVQRLWTSDYVAYPAPHLLGTARMGKDARTSVINADHRTHDVPNLFLCDGSSMVTGGRGQPTMTIMALAFRAGERIAALAKRGEV